MDPNENSQNTAPAVDPMQAAREEDAKFWKDLDAEEDDSPALTGAPPQSSPEPPASQEEDGDKDGGEEDDKPEQKPAAKPDKPWKKGEGQAVPLATLLEERRGRQEMQRLLDDPDALERRLQELRSRSPGASAPGGVSAGDPAEFRPFAKTVDDFGGDPSKWLEAMQRHSYDEGRRVERVEAQTRAQADQAAQSEARMRSEFEARTEEAAKANPEVKEAVAWFVQQPFAANLPAELRLAIGTDPQGPEKVFALLNDPQLANQVFSAPGALGAFAFSRIQVGSQQPAQQKPAAPPVIPAVPRAPSGGRGTGGGSDPLDSDDFDEFGAAFDKRMASRKRRS